MFGCDTPKRWPEVISRKWKWPGKSCRKWYAYSLPRRYERKWKMGWSLVGMPLKDGQNHRIIRQKKEAKVTYYRTNLEFKLATIWFLCLIYSMVKTTGSGNRMLFPTVMAGAYDKCFECPEYWDCIQREFMTELTITSPYVDSRVDSNTCTMSNPMPESTLSPRQGLRIWPL